MGDIAGNILEVESTHDSSLGEGTLLLKLNDRLGKQLRRITSKATRMQLGIIIEGKLVQAPWINTPLDSEVKITGSFSAQQMQHLRQVLDVSQQGLSSKIKSSVIDSVDEPTVKLYAVVTMKAAAMRQWLHEKISPDLDIRVDQRANMLIIRANNLDALTCQELYRGSGWPADITELPEFQKIRIDIEPKTAVETLRKFFDFPNNESAPIIDADPAGKELYVKATPEQMEQIMKILEKLQEANKK